MKNSLLAAALIKAVALAAPLPPYGLEEVLIHRPLAKFQEFISTADIPATLRQQKWSQALAAEKPLGHRSRHVKRVHQPPSHAPELATAVSVTVADETTTTTLYPKDGKKVKRNALDRVIPIDITLAPSGQILLKGRLVQSADGRAGVELDDVAIEEGSEHDSRTIENIVPVEVKLEPSGEVLISGQLHELSNGKAHVELRHVAKPPKVSHGAYGSTSSHDGVHILPQPKKIRPVSGIKEGTKGAFTKKPTKSKHTTTAKVTTTFKVEIQADQETISMSPASTETSTKVETSTQTVAVHETSTTLTTMTYTEAGKETTITSTAPVQSTTTTETWTQISKPEPTHLVYLDGLDDELVIDDMRLEAEEDSIPPFPTNPDGQGPIPPYPTDSDTQGPIPPFPTNPEAQTIPPFPANVETEATPSFPANAETKPIVWLDTNPQSNELPPPPDLSYLFSGLFSDSSANAETEAIPPFSEDPGAQEHFSMYPHEIGYEEYLWPAGIHVSVTPTFTATAGDGEITAAPTLVFTQPQPGAPQPATITDDWPYYPELITHTVPAFQTGALVHHLYQGINRYEKPITVSGANDITTVVYRPGHRPHVHVHPKPGDKTVYIHALPTPHKDLVIPGADGYTTVIHPPPNQVTNVHDPLHGYPITGHLNPTAALPSPAGVEPTSTPSIQPTTTSNDQTWETGGFMNHYTDNFGDTPYFSSPDLTIPYGPKPVPPPQGESLMSIHWGIHGKPVLDEPSIDWWDMKPDVAEPLGVAKPDAVSHAKPALVSDPKPALAFKLKPDSASKPKPVFTFRPKPAFTSTSKLAFTAKPKLAFTSKPKPALTSKPKPASAVKPKPDLVPDPKPAVAPEPKPVIVADIDTGSSTWHSTAKPGSGDPALEFDSHAFESDRPVYTSIHPSFKKPTIIFAPDPGHYNTDTQETHFIWPTVLDDGQPLPEPFHPPIDYGVNEFKNPLVNTGDSSDPSSHWFQPVQAWHDTNKDEALNDPDFEEDVWTTKPDGKWPDREKEGTLLFIKPKPDDHYPTIELPPVVIANKEPDVYTGDSGDATWHESPLKKVKPDAEKPKATSKVFRPKPKPTTTPWGQIAEPKPVSKPKEQELAKGDAQLNIDTKKQQR